MLNFMICTLWVLGAALCSVGALSTNIINTDANLRLTDIFSADNGRDCTPEQVHIALTGVHGEMRVSWKTSASNCSTQLLSYWHTNSVALSHSDSLLPLQREVLYSQEIIQDGYSRSDMCNSPASDSHIPPLHLHSAVLTNLKPGSLVTYQPPGGDQTYRFKAPVEPHASAPLSFVVYGDMGESVHSWVKCPGAQTVQSAISAEVEAGKIDMIWHVGDISYANGHHQVWEAFLESIEPFASAVPYHIAVGNHEYDYERNKHSSSSPTDPSGADLPYNPDWGNYGNDSGGECGVPVTRRFPMPALEQANPPFWYSFEQGPVHFLTISTEHSLRPVSVQYKWIESDLQSVDRCKTPWVLVGMHRPIYVPFPHKANRIVADHVRASIEQLFEDHGVDMVFTGHVHSYFRTCNVFAEECIPESEGGMVHVTIGTGGKKLSDVSEDQPTWLEKSVSEYGYGRVTLDGSSRSLLFEFVAAEDGQVLDWVTLHNGRSAMNSQCANDGGQKMTSRSEF